MTLGNFSNNSISNYPVYPQNVAGQNFNNTFPTSNVNIPTLLPPSGRGFGNNFASKISREGKDKKGLLSNSLTKVKGYFKRLGQALIGVRDKSEISEKNFAVPSKLDPEDFPSSREFDPVVGQWPASFNGLSQPLSKRASENLATKNSPLGEEMDSETKADSDSKARSEDKLAQMQKELLSKQDPFGDLMQEMNQSQMDNQSLFNNIQ